MSLARAHRISPAAACLALLLSACGSTRATVSTFPAPGSQVASAQTEITFRGVPIRDVGRVVVTGSLSGSHGGRMMADSDRRGGAFIPRRPFVPGEIVNVRTKLRVQGAAEGHWQFKVATPAGAIPNAGLPLAKRMPGDVVTLRSRPDLSPPAVEITKQPASDGAGDIFVAPQQGPVQSGPMILDPTGALIWFQPLPKGDVGTDFRVQRYAGRPVLTWWQGHIGAGVGVGEDVIEDTSYTRLRTVRAGNGLSADLHEFELTPDGTALITAYYPVYWDASSVRGAKRQIVLDSIVQEIDVKTGLVRFQWDSLDHVPVTDSYEPLPKTKGAPYDYFHVNSVQRDSDGNFIVSARNTWAAYKISHRTGRVMWTLGGKRSSFKMDPAARFAFQHDVRTRSDDDGTVTVFDDGAGPPAVHDQSRGLTLRLDTKHGAAKLARQDVHAPALLANFEGNVQRLSNGDHFLGWGQQPFFTEFDTGGQVVFDAKFLDGNSTYRAYRFPWRGTPRTRPMVSAQPSPGATTLFVSWNGATEVRSWRVMTGQAPDQLRTAANAVKQGFETEISVASAPYMAVQALDSAGHVLATSDTVKPSASGA